MIVIKDLIIITGPTASGKTALSVELAKRLDGEIVNADSMQIYKYMDIGTAKPTIEEREGIPHHMIDIAMPSENYSAAKYCEKARAVIDEIRGRGKIPIMVGGTGLYVDSIADNIQFAEIEPDEQYRRDMEDCAREKGNGYIYNMLLEIDPDAAQKIAVADTKRIIRALEVYHSTGITITEHNRRSRSVPSPYNTMIFAIDTDREVLYEKINRRVDIMMEQGLLDEVKSILEMGVSDKATSMQAIGYKEIAQYLKGEITLEGAVDLIKKGSRHYAKRQLTWFRRNDKIHWIKNDVNEALKIINMKGSAINEKDKK